MHVMADYLDDLLDKRFQKYKIDCVEKFSLKMFTQLLTKLVCFALILNDGVFAKKYKKASEISSEICHILFRSNVMLKRSTRMMKELKATVWCAINVSFELNYFTWQATETRFPAIFCRVIKLFDSTLFSSCFYLHLVRYMDWYLLDSSHSLLRLSEYQFRGKFYWIIRKTLFKN